MIDNHLEHTGLPFFVQDSHRIHLGLNCIFALTSKYPAVYQKSMCTARNSTDKEPMILALIIFRIQIDHRICYFPPLLELYKFHFNNYFISCRKDSGYGVEQLKPYRNLFEENRIIYCRIFHHFC